MFNILPYLPAKNKLTPSGWRTMNAVCCHHRGERADQRGRGGILINSDQSIIWNCFNCGFSASFTPGEHLSKNFKLLLGWLNVDQAIINKLNLQSLRHRNLYGIVESHVRHINPKFEVISLPETADKLDINNPHHKVYADYLKSRSIDSESMPYYVTPNDIGRDNNRIIIPFTHDDTIIGYASRYLDNQLPKYVKHNPPGYVFNLDNQSRHWKYLILVEGIFDAIQINGVAVLHHTVNDNQARLINSFGKQVIVVPDRDKAGEKMIKKAIEYHWGVSFPEWDSDIKDTADAVARYGKIATLISIIESVEKSSLKIELKRKHLHAH
jgi:hypothetical protein